MAESKKEVQEVQPRLIGPFSPPFAFLSHSAFSIHRVHNSSSPSNWDKIPASWHLLDDMHELIGSVKSNRVTEVHAWYRTASRKVQDAASERDELTG